MAAAPASGPSHAPRTRGVMVASLSLPASPLLQGNAHELDQLMQEGIRDVLGGSQGSLLPIPGLPGARRPPAASPATPLRAPARVHAWATLAPLLDPLVLTPRCARAEGGQLPIVDQQGHLQLGSLELPPLLPGEPDVASQVRDTSCSAPRRQAPPSAPMSEDEVDQDEEEEEEEEEPGGGGVTPGGDAGNETGSSGRPGRGVKRKKAGKGAKRGAAPVS